MIAGGAGDRRGSGEASGSRDREIEHLIAEICRRRACYVYAADIEGCR